MIEVVTPAGIGIRYQPETEGKRTYWVSPAPFQWYEVPSVTQVLDILDKPALPWWGMRVGFRAVAALVKRGEMMYYYGRGGSWYVKDDEGEWQPANFEDKANVERAIVRNKLSTNHVRDEGGVRGTAAHAAFEAWASTGARAAPSGYPAEQAPYVEAFLKFAEDMTVSGSHTEVMVGSVVTRFAGRYDFDGVITGEAWNGIGNRAEKVPYEAVSSLLDVKTSKYVYSNHFLQLEAYEGARVECGYPPTTTRLVLHLKADGRYELKESTKDYADFVAVRLAYNSVS